MADNEIRFSDGSEVAVTVWRSAIPPRAGDTVAIEWSDGFIQKCTCSPAYICWEGRRQVFVVLVTREQVVGG